MKGNERVTVSKCGIGFALAGTLALAGCLAPAGVNPGVQPTQAPPVDGASPSPVPAPVATDSGAGSGATGAAAGGAQASPGGTPSPVPPSEVPRVVVSGTVYNEKGAPVDGATVTARSTDGVYNFETKTSRGAYVFNEVPAGVVVEYTATKENWTRRSRTETFQVSRTGEKNEVNFGSAGGVIGLKGDAYFISDFPEIAAVSPGDDATEVDFTALTYKLTMSEPLTADGRDRLLDAFRIVPDNGMAKDGVSGAGNNLENGENAAVFDGIATSVFGYELKKNDAFLDSDTNLVRGSWNESGTELTITFNGALRTGEKEGGRYAALLLTDGLKIEDEQGNQLGTSELSMTAYPSGAAAGSLRVLYNVFKADDLVLRQQNFLTYRLQAIAPPTDVGLDNWAATHNTVADFQLAKDTKAPVLQSVRGHKRSDGNLRIELEFDEPMAAFGGNGQGVYSDNELFDLGNYSFAFGTETGKTAGTKLDGVTAAAVLKASGTAAVYNAGSGSDRETFAAETEFAFTNTAASGIVVPSTLAQDASAASPAIEVAGSNPKAVYIWIGKGNTLVSGLKEIKARVAGVTDPAGNAISASDADANVRTGSVD